MLAAGIFTASAATATLSLGENQTVKRGETVTVELSLLTDFASDAFQFDINLPAGLAFVKSGTKAAITRGEGTPYEGMNLSHQLRNNESAVRFIAALNEDGYQIPCNGTACVLLSFKVITENAEAGDYVITLSNAVVTDCTDVLHKVSVRNPTLESVTITIIEPEYNLVADDEIMPATSLLEVVDGTATLSVTEVYLRADHEGGYNYSVTYGTETYCTGEALTVNDNGKYNVTFTFDEEAKTIVATATFVEYATSIDNADATSVEKLVIDGQVYIRKNGVLYNALGQKL